MKRYFPSIFLLTLIIVGCPTEDAPLSDDIGSTSDVEFVDVRSEDVQSEDIETVDVSCETFCEDKTIFIEGGTDVFPFTRAAYGLSSPQQTESGQWEIHVEAWEGGFTGCPEQDSPTPARQLLLSGLKLPEGGEVQGDEDGVALTLLDYQGDVVTAENPISRASVVRVLPMRWEICTECVGGAEPSHEEGELVLRLEAVFEEGELSGELVARHCDSLDLP
ncbi:MAG: hypothetical protein ACNA8W_09630 [Bradymonadaceae bacterium]